MQEHFYASNCHTQRIDRLQNRLKTLHCSVFFKFCRNEDFIRQSILEKRLGNDKLLNRDYSAVYSDLCMEVIDKSVINNTKT